MGRKKFSAKMKGQVALEVIKNDATIEELAQTGLCPDKV